MNTQPVGHKVKAFGARKLAFLFLIIVLLVPACARQPQPASIEEITFQSGEFTLVGDLRTPSGSGPFPVILFIHSSGPSDRSSTSTGPSRYAAPRRCRARLTTT